MADKKLDVIIFGATGFTGKYTVFEAVSVLKGLSWGIAGRSEDKLQSVLREMGAKSKTDLSKTPIVMVEMAKRCRIVVNTAGPYRFFGERVVKACIEAGTHHVDISGEPTYMETMQLRYNDLAKERGVYVISACAFDSIPADMGVTFVEKNFDGVVNSVENFVHVDVKDGTRGLKAAFNTGTWESVIHFIGNRSESEAIRRKLFPERLPKFQPVLKARSPFSRAAEVDNKVILPLLETDRSVVTRSQRFLYEQEKKRPVQMEAYVTYTWYEAFAVAFFTTIIGIMAKFAFGRNLLFKYPGFFSGGMASREGPSEEQTERTFFRMTMKATGWPRSEKLAEGTDQYSTPPTKTMTVLITGPNPAYGSTCVVVLCTAKIILNESDKMPGTGGVLPPGAAFRSTSLISELEKHEHGIKFEIVANK